MNAKHTPGPWHVGEQRREFIDINHEGNEPGQIGRTIALAIARPSWVDEGNANARLIAAAPDLLSALEGMLEVYCTLVDSGDAGNWNPEADAPVIQARASIAKAKGL